MSVLTALYNLLIGPLELLFEIIFALANRVIDNPGLAIIFLSLAVNFLVLPLYKQADAMQEESRKTEAKLNPWVTHIKKTFKGDERFMILQTYYRQNNYKPTDALKGSVSLLLEIPFFMAAYNFLSELQLLQGVSFGPIQDLGAPDSMLVIAGVTIHVLPVLMTLINLISGAIYTKGFPLKSKIQLYGMALIFLVLLYDSPSGLVFYWTLNNLFSLVKNIFYKLKNPKLVLSILSSVLGAAAVIVVLFIHPMGTTRTQIIVLAALLMLQLPLVFYAAKKRIKTTRTVEVSKTDKFLFFAGCVFITLLTGLLIPSTVVKASPEEFISTITFHNPMLYVMNALLLAAGTFLVWFGIFYMLANNSGKKVMGLAIWVFSAAAVVNYMFFGTDYGSLTSELKYDFYPNFTKSAQLTNLAVLVVVFAAGYMIWKKKAEIVKAIYIAAGLAVLGMSVFNIAGIQAVVPDAIAKLEVSAQEKVSIPLSKNGKNVVVLMMDRAVNGYIPYLFQEKPELQEQFAGFTYYPNTISYGAHTNFGSPVLYGGYEYTPEEMNKRSTELLEDKQNEALKVMPVMFNQEGYEVTVCDPSYAGYRWIPDLSIYDEYPDIHKFNTIGHFDEYSREKSAVAEQMLNRNFFCYSIFKVAPVIIQPTLYTQGSYNQPDFMVETDTNGQTQHSPSTATGIRGRFMKSYGVLQSLPDITNITDGSGNTFVMMSNDTTHEPMLLQEPEYVPAEKVDNTEYDAAHTDRFVIDGRRLKMEQTGQVMGYHINMAAMLQLGNWLDYLRANDVYDNTRIIIVSDHGYYMNQFDDMRFGKRDIMAYNPLLMIKDFDSQEFTTDYTFMTNGDVPTLATNDLIQDPTNPFTGKPINSDPKNQPEQHVFTSTEYNTAINNGTTFIPGDWLAVKNQNIFDMDNWTELGKK